MDKCVPANFTVAHQEAQEQSEQREETDDADDSVVEVVQVVRTDQVELYQEVLLEALGSLDLQVVGGVADFVCVADEGVADLAAFQLAFAPQNGFGRENVSHCEVETAT